MKMQHSEQSGSIEFPITPAGTHIARCVQMIDQGTQVVRSQWGEKIQRKLFVLYELPLKLNTFTDKEGNEKTLPFGMPKTYTNSTYEKAALYQHLEAWFGEEFTQSPETFDLKRMLDKPCMISIAHKQGDDGKYAVVAGVTALPDGMECPPRVNPLVFLDLDAFDRGVFDALSDKMKNRIALSDEYRVMTGQVGQRPQQESQQQAQQPRQDRENPAPMSEFVPKLPVDIEEVPF